MFICLFQCYHNMAMHTVNNLIHVTLLSFYFTLRAEATFSQKCGLCSQGTLTSSPNNFLESHVRGCHLAFKLPGECSQ